MEERHMQKIILLPIYHGMRAKNFFYTDTYRALAKDSGIRMVIAAPSAKMAYYREAFPEKNVVFEPLDIDPHREHFFGKILSEFAFNTLDTKTIRFKQKLQYAQYGNYPRFVFKRLLNRFFGKLAFIRSLIRALDRMVPIDRDVVSLLDRYKPDLVLAPDSVFPIDRIFLRAAKRKGYFTVGLFRSWDNITAKGVIQVLPDRLILHTHRMKRQAVELVGIKEEDTVVTGPPDFDDYFKPMKKTRAEFFKSLNIPEDRRVILFTPFYDKYMGGAICIMNALTRAMNERKIPADVHILLRYRPGLQKDIRRALDPNPRLTITEPCARYFYAQHGKKNKIIDWEFSAEEVELLVDSIYYSDIMINTVSTLTIDATACDRPVIGIRFDADPACKREHSISFLMDMHDHYREIEETGGVALVHNTEELVSAINRYLENPALDREGRARIREEQIEFFDGKNGARAAEYIRQFASRDHSA